MTTRPDNAAPKLNLSELIEFGQVTPAIDRTYPLSESAAAIRPVSDDRARGKVALTVGSP